MKKYKICTNCKKKLPATTEYFYRRRDISNGLGCQCKNCRKRYNTPTKIKNYYLKREYGISIEDYENLLKAQDNCCAICGISNNKIKKIFKKSLDVDHNHKDGSIRGLLCNKCNQLLGYCRENIMILDNAIAYLYYFNKIVDKK